MCREGFVSGKDVERWTWGGRERWSVGIRRGEQGDIQRFAVSVNRRGFVLFAGWMMHREPFCCVLGGADAAHSFGRDCEFCCSAFVVVKLKAMKKCGRRGPSEVESRKWGALL